MLALALELCPILCYSPTHCGRHGYASFPSCAEGYRGRRGPEVEVIQDLHYKTTRVLTRRYTIRWLCGHSHWLTRIILQTRARPGSPGLGLHVLLTLRVLGSFFI